MNQTKQLIEWLSDAHAMEQGIITMLKAHAQHAQDFPELQNGIEKHLAITEQHAEKIKRCLETLGADTSVFKMGAAKAQAFLAALPTSITRDAVIKQVLAAFATEHFEIACYTSLIAAATQLGFHDIAATCRDILKDEEIMADFLSEMIEEVTAEHLQNLEPSTP